MCQKIKEYQRNTYRIRRNTKLDCRKEKYRRRAHFYQSKSERKGKSATIHQRHTTLNIIGISVLNDIIVL
jgi:hypothetical protein